MITCKICESDIQGQKLREHSSQCKQVTELKESLFQLQIKMETYTEKASVMKNCLETYAAKQKKSQKNKFLRSNSINITEQESTPPSANLVRNNSADKSHPLESPESENGKNTEGTPKSEANFSNFYEPAKKMSDDQHEKVITEAKKGVFALKKIITYANKIHGGIYGDALNFDVKNELELIYADILDAKKYMELREKYSKESEKLAELTGEDQYNTLKHKFQTQKSRSFNLKRSFRSKAPRKGSENYKEDSFSSSKDSTNADFDGGSREKDDSSRHYKTPNVISSRFGVLKSLNFSSMSELVQQSSNLKTKKSSFSGNKKASIDAFRGKLNHITTDGLNIKNKENVGEMLSEHQDALKRYRSHARDKKNRYTVTHMNNIQLFASHSDKEKKTTDSQSNTPIRKPNSRKLVKPHHRRTNSLDLHKPIHKEESFIHKLPSIVIEKPGLQESKNLADKVCSKISVESPYCCESPALKGYYSDNDFKRKNKTDLASESSQVSIQDFEPIKFIGKGAYGTVWLVRKKATGDEYAMKIVDWADREAQNRLSALKLERDIYKMLEGDNVVKAIWTFHYEHFICFVTEFMIGGDFNKLLDQLGRLDDDQARFYFAELVLAVESLHNLGIVHRDLKPDNILMDSKGHIRLTDFGLSRAGLDKYREHIPCGFSKKNSMTSPIEFQNTADEHKKATFFDIWGKAEVGINEDHIEFKTKKSQETIFGFLREESSDSGVWKEPTRHKKLSLRDSFNKKKIMVGTPDYMAPETIDCDRINGTYNEKCMDWWSLGIILYQFLVGVPPFCDDTVEKVFDNIVNYRIEWPSIGYGQDCITPEAVDLIKKLLEPNPSKRLGVNGAREVKNHPFFKGFNWEGLREREAPIVPSTNEDEETSRVHDFPPARPGKPKLGSTKRHLKQIDLAGFQMRRLDVLDKLNQETYKRLHQTQDFSSDSNMKTALKTI